MLLLYFQDSDGEKSDDLVVDVSNEVRRVLNCSATFFSRRLQRNQTEPSFVCRSLNTFHCVAKTSGIILVVGFQTVYLINFSLPFMQNIRQRIQREKGVTGECMHMCEGGSMSTHGDIYLCLPMRPQLV